MRSIRERFTPIIQQRGIAVQVSTVYAQGETTTCPCILNSPWQKYDPQWHLSHPESPDCEGTGKILIEAAAAPATEEVTIQAVVIPNYGATGTEMDSLMAGLMFSWKWMAVTQATESFNRLSFTDGAGVVYIFKVENRMPYFLENNLEEPTVIIYTLLPVQMEEPHA